MHVRTILDNHCPTMERGESLRMSQCVSHTQAEKLKARGTKTKQLSTVRTD